MCRRSAPLAPKSGEALPRPVTHRLRSYNRRFIRIQPSKLDFGQRLATVTALLVAVSVTLLTGSVAAPISGPGAVITKYTFGTAFATSFSAFIAIHIPPERHKVATGTLGPTVITWVLGCLSMLSVIGILSGAVLYVRLH